MATIGGLRATRGRFSYPSGDVDFRVGHDLYELTVVRPEAGTATRLALGNFPAWSPDGQRIAFVSTYWHTFKRAGGDPPSRVIRVDRLVPTGGEPQSRVQIMAADGTDLRTVELPAGRSAGYPPRWSPDGTRLAFLVYEEGRGAYGTFGTFAIYTVGADGTGLQRLASHARSNPAWSPDGTRLAFVQANEDRLHVYTMAADGTDGRQITAAPISSRWAWTLAWSPDGSRLLYGMWQWDLRCGSGRPGGGRGERTADGVVGRWTADSDLQPGAWCPSWSP